MTTLAIMQARIASELRRSNIDDQIASAITTAIDAYKHERFYFNETRTITFNTVDTQWQYDGDDDADLGNLLRIDYVHATIGDNVYSLSYIKPADLERLNSDGDFEGQPLNWSYYQGELWFYPIPNDVFAIRVGGVIAKAAPASDSEADNVWMVEAEKLIRCRAKYELYTHVLMDQIKAAIFNPDNDTGPTAQAHKELLTRTNWLVNQGGSMCVEPTCF